MNSQSIFLGQRAQFPALERQVAGQPAVFFDGPAGTQVPNCVIEAIREYLVRHNANHGGCFLTSQESDAMLDETHRAVADLLGASDPETIAFGANMTTLTFALSRSLARTWKPGDEVLVTRLDHDANFTPWVMAARDAGAEVKVVDFRPEDCTLDLEDFRRKLSSKTRLVAVGCASNATGTRNPIPQLVQWAHDAGALIFLDAVHYAPHALVDVENWGCDFLACSAYKFFGPHVGILWGRRHLLEELTAYKVRPASNSLPGKWMTGTQNHECLAGVLAAVRYLETLGRSLGCAANATRREALRAAMNGIEEVERELSLKMLAGLAQIPEVRLHGIADPQRVAERFPTFAITHAKKKTSKVAIDLAHRGIFTWHGNYYALNLTETLGLEPEGMVRIGLVHYNTAEEVDRLLAELRHAE
jgi:cysteine desulfurase family protein (TIGR01976 family)